ncbi:response regulator [Reinekea sp. G2M2-21]|uniref:response regulator n=1 Tax=Reinekea sp. G2M2-21 TaxID=2788942 RepID=UPI0018A89D2B|nr:response regulator [Reinekea sp. G2M2-21]
MKKDFLPGQKTALVVDDSKLARYVLKEMLMANNIKVETAESAEEALGSLSSFKPDVIFMDHMMPGMDGFQAVQAIKNDPKTAMIPIMMYTSKDGEVYVSQARALGAVGVLPKKLKPVQLENVLQKLKLIPSKDDVAVVSKPKPIAIPSEEITARPKTKNTLEELALSASEELEKDTMRHLFRQLFNEQRDSIKQDQHELVDSLAAKVPAMVLSARKPTFRKRLITATAAMVAVGLVGFLVVERVEQERAFQKAVFDQLAQYQQQWVDVQNTLLTAQASAPVLPALEKTDFQLGLGTFSWAINQHGQVPYQSSILSTQTKNYLTELLDHLEQNNFTGLVVVKVHSGQFCELHTQWGARYLAPEDSAVADCELEPLEDATYPWLELPEFEQYLSVLALYYPGIDLKLDAMGSSFSRVNYPDLALNPSAGEWNRAAAVNNRLEFDFIQQSSAPKAALAITPTDS